MIAKQNIEFQEKSEKMFFFLPEAGVNVLSPENPVLAVVAAPKPVAGFCAPNNPPVGAAVFAPKVPKDEPTYHSNHFQ